MMVVAPVGGRVVSFGMLVGQAQTRSVIIADAVTDALASYRLQAFPTDPGSPWKVSSAFFARLVSKAVGFATETGAPSGYSFTSAEVAAAFVRRGYTISDLNPFTRQPLAISTVPVVDLPVMLAPSVEIPAPPAAPVIYLPGQPPLEPAPIRYQTVTVPGPPAVPPMPVIIEQVPSPLQREPSVGVPAISPPAEVRPASGTKWLLAAGLAAVLLSRAA